MEMLEKMMKELQFHYELPFEDTNIPDDCLIRVMKGVLGNARNFLLGSVFDVGNHEMDWIYHPGWNSIGMLLAHVISREHITRIKWIEKRELTKDEEEIYLPAHTGNLQKNIDILKGHDIEYYYEHLKQSRKALFHTLEQTSLRDLVEDMSSKSGDITTNLFWLISHVAEDELHHRGQIVMIRKLYNLHDSKN